MLALVIQINLVILKKNIFFTEIVTIIEKVGIMLVPFRIFIVLPQG